MPPPYAPGEERLTAPEYKVDYTPTVRRETPEASENGAYNKPVGFTVSSVLKPENRSVEYSANGQHANVYSPTKPNYLWQEDKTLTGERYSLPYKLLGYYKDGTHGTWGIREKAGLYKKEITYPTDQNAQ